jgi:hypothetical protein
VVAAAKAQDAALQSRAASTISSHKQILGDVLKQDKQHLIFLAHINDEDARQWFRIAIDLSNPSARVGKRLQSTGLLVPYINSLGELASVRIGIGPADISSLKRSDEPAAWANLEADPHLSPAMLMAPFAGQPWTVIAKAALAADMTFMAFKYTPAASGADIALPRAC